MSLLRSIHYIACACVAPRRRDLWRQDVLSRRHILQRRSPGSISAKKADKKMQTGPWGLAARQRGGRPYFLQFSPFREIISHMFTFL